jgi:hypothetical protein
MCIFTWYTFNMVHEIGMMMTLWVETCRHIYNFPYVSEVINERIDEHLNKLESHPNPLAETLTQPMRNRRLKRRWTSDLNDWGDIAGWSPYQDNKIRIAN